MPGARCTRGLVCKMHKEMRTRAYRFSGGIRHPLRDGFTAYAVLSPATNSSCHRHRRIERLLNPGRVELATADLAPATGVRTTRFCRTRPVFAKRLRRAKCQSAEALAKAETSFVLRACESLTRFNPPCDINCAPTLSRPPHPIPRS
jgi:hypothetical protein